jgi:hypothetical protein
VKTKKRKHKKLCAECGKRPALFPSPSHRGGLITKDDGHDLCKQCENALRDRLRRPRNTFHTLGTDAR